MAQIDRESSNLLEHLLLLVRKIHSALNLKKIVFSMKIVFCRKSRRKMHYILIISKGGTFEKMWKISTTIFFRILKFWKISEYSVLHVSWTKNRKKEKTTWKNIGTCKCEWPLMYPKGSGQLLSMLLSDPWWSRGHAQWTWLT